MHISSSATSKFSCGTAYLKPSMCLKTSKGIKFSCSKTPRLYPIHWFGCHTWMGNLTGITHNGHLPCQIYHDCNWQEYSKHLHGISICERLNYDSKQIDHFWRFLGVLLRPGLQACEGKLASFWVCNDKPPVCIRRRGWTYHHQSLQTGLWGW